MALNAVFAALVKEFADSQQISNEDEGSQFEHFVNFSVVADIYSDEFNAIDIATGEHEFGLDGIAIIVNGALVEDEDEIDELIERNKHLKVEFIFTQAKTSASFDGGDLVKFCLAVEDFFGPLKLLKGRRVKDRYALKEYIYKKAAHFRHGRPIVSMFYATTGAWKNDATLLTLIENHRVKLMDTGLFDLVVFTPVDGDRLRGLYFRAQHAVRQQIKFEKYVTVPAIKDVEEAYIGVLPVGEYLKLIVDENGALRKRVFFDNMRDFMQDTDTNKEISETLTSSRSGEFPLRNNGVTIVVRRLGRTGDVFDLEDYQIVNGCQTSHVIFNNRLAVSSNIVVPVKIISTKQDDVVNKVIRGSNFSNQFDPSQLWATEQFHKDLEVYFGSLKGDRQLFYERRKGQFSAAVGVEKVRIVTPVGLLKASASIFLERPHDVTKYISKLDADVGKNIFVQGHNPIAYQAAAYAAYRLEGLFRSKMLATDYKPLRHHLLMGLKVAHLSDKTSLSDKNLAKKLEPLFETLDDPAKTAAILNKLVAEADRQMTAQGAENYRQLAKSASLRDRIYTFAQTLAKPPMK